MIPSREICSTVIVRSRHGPEREDSAMPRLAVLALAIAVTFAGPAVAEPNREVIDKATALFSRDVEERGDAIVYFIERHDTDAIAALIFAHRFTSEPRAAAALTILTGETGPTT
jgi:hypothetical protein